MVMKTISLLVLLAALLYWKYFYQGDLNNKENVLHDEALFSAFHSQFEPNPDVKSLKVLVIGSGIGGASTAYFLNTLFNKQWSQENTNSQQQIPDIQLQVVEKNDEIGGRTQKQIISGVTFDIGATSIVVENFYAVHLVEKYNLTKHRIKAKMAILEPPQDPNGSAELKFEESDYAVVTLYKMLRQFGFDFVKMMLQLKNLIFQVKKTYVFQNAFETFDDAFDWLKTMGLQDMAKSSFIEYYIKSGTITNFNLVNQLLQPIFHVNYMQNASINAFAACIGLAPLASKFYTIKESTSSFAKLMLEEYKSTTNVLTSTEVTSIQKHGNGYKVVVKSTKAGDNTTTVLEADKVVIASPLVFSNISFEGFAPDQLPRSMFTENREFVKIYVNVVVAKGLNYESTFFTNALEAPLPVSDDEVEPLPHDILLTNVTRFPYSAMISIKGSSKDNPELKLYKTFSFVDIPEDEMGKLFIGMDHIVKKHWSEGVYPVLKPRTTTIPFKLAEGLYYQGALETVVSTMETQMIASRNVAYMIAKEVMRYRD